MQVVETLKEGLKREYKVLFNPSEITKIISDKLNEISKSVKVDGFRPGKVPFEVIKKKYYEAVKSEELPKFLELKINKYLADNGVVPLGQPQIDNLEFIEDEKFELVLRVDIMPQIEEPDYSSIKLEKLVCDIAEDEVEESLKSIADNTKNYVTKDEESAKGDKVIIDFVGSIEGKEFEGGKGENFGLVLGSKTFIDNFEDQLIGLSVGSERVVSVTFPENYGKADLAGKPAQFKVTVKEVQKEIESKIDEDLATRVGFASLEELKSKVKQQLELNYSEIGMASLKKDLFDKLETMYDIDLPEKLVKQEFDTLWSQVKPDSNHQHDENCNHDYMDSDKPEEELRSDYQKISERRVKLGLILAEVGRMRNVQITNDELKQAIFREARQYPGQEHVVIEYFRKNPQAMESLKAPVLEDKVVSLMLNSVETTDKKVSSKELLDVAKSLK